MRVNVNVKLKGTLKRREVIITHDHEDRVFPPLGILRSNDADGNENVKKKNNRFYK